MFHRTYRPLINSELHRFAGFESKATDFDSGFSVARVGRTTEGGGPDPDFYDIFAVEFKSERFLFKVEARAPELGEINGHTMVSVGTSFCDHDPVTKESPRISSSFKPSNLNPLYTTVYDFCDVEEFDLVTRILTEGVRRLNFSCDAERYEKRPVQYCAEFRFRDPPSGFGPEQQLAENRKRKAPGPTLASLLAMKQYIDTRRFIEGSSTLSKEFGERSSLASTLLPREGEINRSVTSKRRNLTEEARVWIEENDRTLPPEAVLAALADPSNAAKLTDLEWVLAQLVALEPTAAVYPDYTPGSPVNLEKVISEPSVQKIFRSIYTDQFNTCIESFDTFFSQIIFALTTPYIIRRNQVAASQMKMLRDRAKEDLEKEARIRAGLQQRRVPGPDHSD
ncbi:hypothetical protein [Pelagibius marinus]|uniref:hypothetical protein n=1 Tax=Pelagibius marinus TaxID=2762760 RepID=UPI001872BCA1|nr:hypothetical protein [Pelagibius marinus]